MAGRNLLAQPGQPESREFQPWRVRNLIAWVRPNPPVGALGDKWRPATSYLAVATRSASRWWDDIPTRKTLADSPGNRYPRRRVDNDVERGVIGANKQTADVIHPNHAAGAPLLDWWEITPTGFTSRLGAHYATFPDAIVEPLVQAMCPRRVCTTCGTPSQRLVEQTRYIDGQVTRRSVLSKERDDGHHRADDGHHRADAKEAEFRSWNGQNSHTTRETLGTETTRDDGYHEGPGWRPGLVLDPYAGTGTTLLVATGHGREAAGIDIDERNAILAEERLGMFLTINHHNQENTRK